MTTWLPIPGGLTMYAHRYLDPTWGFAMGWNYTLGAALIGEFLQLRPKGGVLIVQYARRWRQQ